MRTLSFSFLLVIAAVGAEPALAELGDIRIEGRPTAIVAQPTVTLADIADVYSPKASDDDAIVALRGLRIGEAPRLGNIAEWSAEQILGQLKAARVNLAIVGYRFPSRVSIQRAARPLTEGELRASIERLYREQARDVEVHAVEVRDPILVEPGDVTLSARELTERVPTQGGRTNFEVTARGEFETTTARLVAALDEWREVPVAARNLLRGTTLAPEDVAMARMKSQKLSPDVVGSLGSLLGYALGQGIAAGQPFEARQIALPIVIPAGSKVTMVVRSGGLEATASGVSLEAGALNQRISVRNEQSKRLVTGRVIEPGLVLIEEGVGR